MIPEHSRVVLTADISADGLVAGDVGTVVHVYNDGAAYEVEFFNLKGETVAVATVEGNELRPVSHMDVTHARTLAAA